MKPIRSAWSRIVKATNPPEYPTITRSELSCYEADDASAQAFSRRFRSSFIGSVAIVFGGPSAVLLFHHLQLIDDLNGFFGFVGSFAIGLGLFIWTHGRMMRARPRSIRSGQDMEVFIIQDRRAEGYYELAYVDRASETYFTAEYIEPGG